MAKDNNIQDFLTDVANAIREKKGTTDAINPQDFSTEIASIQSGGGDIWGFDGIGYTPQNSPIEEWVAYSKKKAEDFTAKNATTLFRQDSLLRIAPNIDYSIATGLEYAFKECTSLFLIPPLVLPSCSKIYGICQSCYSLRYVSITAPLATSLMEAFQRCYSLKEIHLTVGENVTNYSYAFGISSVLEKIETLDFSSVSSMSNCFSQCYKLCYILIKNLGKSSLTTYDFSGASVWGTGGEENRQSLIDSLITYSYDRASNGMTTATIKLSANTKALLTDDEVAQITAKGFTIS